jgi:hypothetical protein
LWEWRIFFQNDLPSKLARFIGNNIKSANFVENRLDFYYSFNDPNIGLKERGFDGSSRFKPILELKIRLEQVEGKIEYWLKRLKIPIEIEVDSNIGIEKSYMSELLEKEMKEEINQFKQYYEGLLSKFKEGKYERIKIHKSREMIASKIPNFGYFKVERTLLEIKKDKWNTIAFETSDSKKLRVLVKKFEPLNDIFIMGYPEFIQKVE